MFPAPTQWLAYCTSAWYVNKPRRSLSCSSQVSSGSVIFSPWNNQVRCRFGVKCPTVCLEVTVKKCQCLVSVVGKLCKYFIFDFTRKCVSRVRIRSRSVNIFIFPYYSRDTCPCVDKWIYCVLCESVSSPPAISGRRVGQQCVCVWQVKTPNCETVAEWAV